MKKSCGLSFYDFLAIHKVRFWMVILASGFPRLHRTESWLLVASEIHMLVANLLDSFGRSEVRVFLKVLGSISIC